MDTVYIGGGRPGVYLSGNGGITNTEYVLRQATVRDDFTAELAAGAINGTDASPGPGERTVADTESKLSISDGRGIFSGGKASPEFNDPGIWWDSHLRAPGRAMTALVRYSLQTGISFVGWAAAADALPINAFRSQGDIGLLSIYDNAGDVYIGGAIGIFEGYDLKLIVVERAEGMLYFAWGYDIVLPSLVWVSVRGSTETMYPSITNYRAALEIDNVHVARADGLYPNLATVYGMATAHSAAPVSGATLTAKADTTIEFTWTPVAAETLSLYFRRTDDNNTWRLDCDQAANTIKIYTRAAGVDTELSAGATFTWTAATPRRIIIRATSDKISVWVDTTIKFNLVNAHQVTATGVKVSGFTTGAHLTAWAFGNEGQYVDLENLFQFTVGGTFLGLGDSKTFATGYRPVLAKALDTATGQTWIERPAIALGSTTASYWATNLSASLATAIGTPTHILCNLGVNDVAASVTEAAFKADYQTIIDLLHAKWPSAKIYLARPWRATIYQSELAAMRTWIADLVTANPGICFLGTDEIAFLEGGDDGATYTEDGIHPNAAGYALTAAAWQTAMGY